MSDSRKTPSIWSRFYSILKQYAEAMDYGIYDVVDEQANRLKALEKNIAMLYYEVKMLKEKSCHGGSTNGDL